MIHSKVGSGTVRVGRGGVSSMQQNDLVWFWNLHLWTQSPVPNCWATMSSTIYLPADPLTTPSIY